MKVTQVYNILNSITKEYLGEVQYVDSSGNYINPSTGEPYKSTDQGVTATYEVRQDLTNVVDIGKQILSSATYDVDNFVRKLIDHIGRVVFVDRKYVSQAPSVLMDGWEYGSVLEKISMDLPKANKNDAWDLQDGTVYEQDRFTSPQGVRYKFFNDAVTFEVEISLVEDQVKSAFSSGSQLNAFFSMIQTQIENTITIKYTGLVRSTINNFIAATVYRDANSLYSGNTKEYDWTGHNSYVRTVNLLGEYQDAGYGATLDAETCLQDLDFLKYAAYRIMLISDRLADMSTLFNIGGKERFTPKDKQHVVLLSNFATAADVYLQSDTFHNELTKLPAAETVNYWQGTGDDYSFDAVSSIHVKSNVASDGVSFGPLETKVSGIIGVIFDREALGVNNKDNKVTSHYNGKGDFMNYWYKSKAQYFNDYDENFIVFIVA